MSSTRTKLTTESMHCNDEEATPKEHHRSEKDPNGRKIMVAITEQDVAYCERTTVGLGQEETLMVHWLRSAVFLLLLVVGLCFATGVFLFTRQQELAAFSNDFNSSATQILDAFASTVERQLAATAELSATLTSHAQQQQSGNSNLFVTLPDFELRASYTRVQTGSHILRWMPLVTDETRDAWEEYAATHRGHIRQAHENDVRYRQEQDDQFNAGASNATVGSTGGGIVSSGSYAESNAGEDSTIGGPTGSNAAVSNVARDGGSPNAAGTSQSNSYNPSIWTSSKGVLPPGSGPYLPDWQRSPVDEGQEWSLNVDWSESAAVGKETLESLIQNRQAIFQPAIEPRPYIIPRLRANLQLSQYREVVDEFVEGVFSFFLYPVLESLDDKDSPVSGVVISSVYWKAMFSNLLPSISKGIICVVHNDLNQTFSYQIDGSEATYLGMHDYHPAQYESYGVSVRIDDYLKQRARPQNTAYRTLPLSNRTGYRLFVYPSRTTADQFLTQKPLKYTCVVVAGFVLAAGLFVVFAQVVEQRQRLMYTKVLENAEKAAAAERELNEFLSHEVRNPLSAAIVASTFVQAALNENGDLDRDTKEIAREDMEVVQSSLHFINDFLRSMVDIYRSTLNQLEIQYSIVDLKQDVIDPVLAIVYKRSASFQVLSTCPENLIITTDPIRLKQVILNLVRNATSFVERGFVRVRSEVTEESVFVYVEDSGPGIPLDKRATLFQKYQQSLDLLHQGTGLGLCLCKRLVENMGGEIWLDDDYESGIEGAPGARFIIKLNVKPQVVNAKALLAASQRNKPRSAACSSELAMIFADDTAVSDTGTPISEVETLIESSPDVENQAAPLAYFVDAQIPTVDDQPQELHPMPLIPNIETPVHDRDFKSTTLLLNATADKKQAEETNSDDPKRRGCAIPGTDHCLRISTTGVPAMADNTTEQSDSQRSSDFRVLFVDDDAMLRKLFVRAVKRARPDWQIKEASSGERALQLCETEDFDVIFLDQYMASTEKQLLGTETARAMRTQGIRSIIYGLSANDVGSGFKQAGADDFILKPFPCRGEALENVLRGLLEKHTSQNIAVEP